MGVDRKMFKSNVWEHFEWNRKTIGSSWVVCYRCCAWCPERATIHDTSNMRHHLNSVHRRRPFKSKQSPRGRRGGASCTLCYKNCFLQKPLRTAKSSHPLDYTCRKGFLHKQWSRTVHKSVSFNDEEINK